MSQDTNDSQLFNSLEGNEGEMSFQNILNFLWRLKWWIIIGAVISMMFAFYIVKLQTPTYRSTTLVKLLDDRTGSPESSVLAEITGTRQIKRIDDEIMILQSEPLMTSVVEELGLNTRYFQYKLPIFHTKLGFLRSIFNIKVYEYYKDGPFEMNLRFNEYYAAESRPSVISIEFSADDESGYKIKELKVDNNQIEIKNNGKHFGDTLFLHGFDMVINRTGLGRILKGDSFRITYSDPSNTGSLFSSMVRASINMGESMRATNMINISIVDTKPKRASDILNTLVSKYNQQAREYKSASTVRSLEFIDDRLLDISSELGAVESRYRDYQSYHNYIEGASGAVNSSEEFDSKLADLKMQATFVSMIKDELTKLGPDDYSVIPANIGIADNGLNQVIASYNELVVERNRLLANSSESNPSVLNYNSQIRDSRENIETAIKNLEQVFNIKGQELSSLKSNMIRQRSYIPMRQFDLAQISRKQQIIEPLFVSLNQKREELQLSLFSITDNVRVISPAKPNYGPISPNKRRIYLLALFIGCFLPIVIMIGRRLLRTKVESKEDIKRHVSSPILATIPIASSTKVISSSGNRDANAESFRMLRSNLQFLQGKVIHVTSSVSGEGKSFVASNLAISLSHIGKKVILLGLDLRKPSLSKNFPDVKYDKSKSIVGFLIGKENDPSALVSNYTSDGWTLDVMFSGFIPPNPSELLAMGRMDILMEYCRNNYDYVICDSAPFFPVPDSTIINRYMDVTLYVIRSDYSEIRMLHDINEAVEKNTLKNVNIILNGIDTMAVKYRYGYGYGYGYGHGYGHYYGYGYGYGSDHSKKKRKKQ